MTLKSRVSPFGNLRIKICSQFPEAYRNVLRPSSPLNAKASTKCSYYTLLNSQTFFIHIKKERMFVIKLTNNTKFRIRYLGILNWNAFSCIYKIFTMSNKKLRWSWWRRTGLNRRPIACKATALPTELRPLIIGGPGRIWTSDPTLIKRVL